MIRYTLLELNFASTFVADSLDQVLAPLTFFDLQLTQIINRTAPLNTNNLATYSGIWSSSFNVNTNEQFSTETRYTFFQRTYTNVTVTIEESLFYVSNEQRPIARQTEIIFHNLLFTIVVLELFGLFFLLIKLLVIPLFHSMLERLQRLSKKNQVEITKEDLNKVVVKDDLNTAVVKDDIPKVCAPVLKTKLHPRRLAVTNTGRSDYKRQQFL